MVRTCLPIFVMAAMISFLTSCADYKDVDANSADFDKFTDIYAALAVGFEFAGHDSTVYMPIRDSILASLDVDTVWIANYVAELGDSPETWLKVWKEVTRKLAARKDSVMP